MVYKHAYLNTLLLTAFRIYAECGEDAGGHALNSHGNYIVDHGKIRELRF